MTKNSKRVLFIIDGQYGFLDGGELGVNGSIDKMDALAKYIKETKGIYDYYFASVDWHPITHCSFKPNGGIWPPHCQQHSKSAAIYQPILDAIDSIGAEMQFFTKGLDESREEYSVVKNIESNKKLHAYIDNMDIDRVDFCGVAGDYCVLDSMSDFHREFPSTKINAILPFIASIDGGTKLLDFLHKNENIGIIDNV